MNCCLCVMINRLIIFYWDHNIIKHNCETEVSQCNELCKMFSFESMNSKFNDALHKLDFIIVRTRH